MNAHIMRNRLSTVNLVWTKNSWLFQYHTSSMFLRHIHPIGNAHVIYSSQTVATLSLHLTVIARTTHSSCLVLLAAFHKSRLCMCISGSSSSLNSSCQPRKINGCSYLDKNENTVTVIHFKENYVLFTSFFTSEISD